MWALLFIQIAAAQKDCMAFSCHPPDVNYGTACYEATDSSASMQLCRGSSAPYCNVDMTSSYPSNCTAAPAQAPQLANPGAPCSQNSDCVNAVCANSVCTGNSTGISCSEHSQCNVGLYCASSSTCQPQVSEGGACYIDYQCVNECGCDKPTYSAGKCVAYYSIAQKETVQFCVQQGAEAVSRLCDSGVCTLATPNENGLGYCAPNAANQAGFASQCMYDSDCVATTSDGQSISGVCECGYGIYGYAYCNAFSGDSPSLTLLSLYKAHIANTTALDTCHTLDRFAADCASKTLNSTAANSLVKNSMLVEDAPAYQDNDYCSEVIFNNDYFQISEADLACPSWSCADQSVSMGSNCLVFTEANNSVYLQNCTAQLTQYGAQETYCDTTAFYSDIYQSIQCTPDANPTNQLPGSACSSNSECYSAVCTSAVCIGKTQGATCSMSQECNVGLYCTRDSVCEALIGVDQSGCYSDYDCFIGGSCNSISSSKAGTCLAMYSLADGAIVPCFNSNGNSTLCASGSCVVDYPQTMTGHCTTAPMLTDSFPKICLTNSDCVGKNSRGETFTGVCKCGFNPYGHSFCTPFAGDSPAADFLTTYRAIVQTNSVDICHTSERYSAACVENLAYSKGSNDALAVLQFYNSTNYGDYQSNDACVKTSVNAYYWSISPTPPTPTPDPDDHDDDDDNAEALMLGILAVIALD